MRVISRTTGCLVLLAAAAVPVGTVSAQPNGSTDPNIVVTGERLPDASQLTKGPEVKGIITARNADRIKVTTTDGSAQTIAIAEYTKIKAGSGLFGGSKKLNADALLNGLPVTVKTLQGPGVLVASEVTFKGGDLKTANMIRTGTNQRFEAAEAATEALRGRMGDIDKYNIKGTTNVYFDTGKWDLSEQAKADLCAVSTQAEATDNALMLVVGYTDTVGSDDYNQTLSEKRASKVMNYLQQVCRWKPYRMLTPTGMAKADPAADNSTPEGRAQNRRVSVNILVSKAVDVD